MGRDIRITDHAYQRGKERLSLGRNSLQRMAHKAFKEGTRHCETKGTLNRFLSKIYFQHGNVNNVRIYGENVFLFVDNILVTLYQLPVDLRKHAKSCKK